LIDLFAAIGIREHETDRGAGSGAHDEACRSPSSNT
jgi:hypothetical protein